MAYIHNKNVSYTEEYQPEHVYVYQVPCIWCKKVHEIRLPGYGLYQYNKGAYVQDAFPELDADMREMLISGTCPDCWEKMFGDEDDTEAED